MRNFDVQGKSILVARLGLAGIGLQRATDIRLRFASPVSSGVSWFSASLKSTSAGHYGVRYQAVGVQQEMRGQDAWVAEHHTSLFG